MDKKKKMNLIKNKPKKITNLQKSCIDEGQGCPMCWETISASSYFPTLHVMLGNLKPSFQFRLPSSLGGPSSSPMFWVALFLH